MGRNTSVMKVRLINPAFIPVSSVCMRQQEYLHVKVVASLVQFRSVTVGDLPCFLLSLCNKDLFYFMTFETPPPFSPVEFNGVVSLWIFLVQWWVFLLNLLIYFLSYNIKVICWNKIYFWYIHSTYLHMQFVQVTAVEILTAVPTSSTMQHGVSAQVFFSKALLSLVLMCDQPTLDIAAGN